MLLMDDTIIPSTSRAQCIEKIKVLMSFCTEYGMRINEKKTKGMVINGTEDDQRTLDVDGKTIEHCTTYTDLGGIFTVSGKMSEVVELEASRGQSYVNKFEIQWKPVIPFFVITAGWIYRG